MFQVETKILLYNYLSHSLLSVVDGDGISAWCLECADVFRSELRCMEENVQYWPQEKY